MTLHTFTLSRHLDKDDDDDRDFRDDDRDFDGEDDDNDNENMDYKDVVFIVAIVIVVLIVAAICCRYFSQSRRRNGDKTVIMATTYDNPIGVPRHVGGFASPQQSHHPQTLIGEPLLDIHEYDEAGYRIQEAAVVSSGKGQSC